MTKARFSKAHIGVSTKSTATIVRLVELSLARSLTAVSKTLRSLTVFSTTPEDLRLRVSMADFWKTLRSPISQCATLQTHHSFFGWAIAPEGPKKRPLLGNYGVCSSAML